MVLHLYPRVVPLRGFQKGMENEKSVTFLRNKLCYRWFDVVYINYLYTLFAANYTVSMETPKSCLPVKQLVLPSKTPH